MKRALARLVSARAPGALPYFNARCSEKGGADCISLLFKSPGAVYAVLLDHFSHSTLSADYYFKHAFLAPLDRLLGRPRLADQLLRALKEGGDERFLNMLKEAAREAGFELQSG